MANVPIYVASSIAGYLHSVGYDMPRVCDVMPLLDVDSTVGALTAQLQDVGSGALYCPRAAPIPFKQVQTGGQNVFASIGELPRLLGLHLTGMCGKRAAFFPIRPACDHCTNSTWTLSSCCR